MTASAFQGPSWNFGQLPPTVSGGTPPDYNSDGGPDLSYAGSGLVDPRYGYKIGGAGNGSPAIFGFAPGINYATVDQVPSAIATANIAALANVVSGTAMTLVSVAGAGITLLATALTIPQTGLTVPKGALVIDTSPGNLLFGQSSSSGVWDPTKTIARAVSITAATSAVGGHFIVSGYDVYGNPQTENINAAAGAATTNGKKGFKFITSVVPQFTDAHNYSIGTSDVIELPLRADSMGYVYATFDNAPVTSPTFVAAVTTAATATTGSVRGTITLPAASDGTKRLQIMQGIPPANVSTIAGLFGVTPA